MHFTRIQRRLRNCDQMFATNWENLVFRADAGLLLCFDISGSRMFGGGLATVFNTGRACKTVFTARPGRSFAVLLDRCCDSQSTLHSPFISNRNKFIFTKPNSGGFKLHSTHSDGHFNAFSEIVRHSWLFPSPRNKVSFITMKFLACFVVLRCGSLQNTGRWCNNNHRWKPLQSSS